MRLTSHRDRFNFSDETKSLRQAIVEIQALWCKWEPDLWIAFDC
jgi:hypothetical protein